MRIAAIYIEDHEYLFDKPQTVNFGGHYFYSFIREGDDIIITRKKNEKFIEDFFVLKKTKSKITNVNAIVGQNGSGKSSLLDIIRSGFIEHGQALPQSNSLFLLEVREKEIPIILRNDFKDIYLIDIIGEEEALKKNRIKLTDKLTQKPQTIYYSPHFDYRLNLNFSDVDSHDISFDKILEMDLAEINEKGTNKNGWSYSPSQELLFKNALRQIEFLSSSLVANEKIFKGIFHLPEQYEPILYFREYKIEEKSWNTPTQFREILELASKKIENELKDWQKIRKYDGNKITNQIDVVKYILKKNVIKSFISVLYRQMEQENTFLREGVFPFELIKEQDELNTLDGYKTFVLFVNNSSLHLKAGKTEKLFKNDTLIQLIELIYNAIDDAKEEHSVTNDSLKTSKEKALQILTYQRKFINEFNTYYYKFQSNDNESVLSDSHRVDEFISYMPLSGRLSSGENALLNLFSRIYNFLDLNLKQNKFRTLKNHYILLLDEADLSFHPSWKKRYIKALLNTIPYFFNELETQPSVQIIFTTHDPLTLSDLPNSNVIYIARKSFDDRAAILDYDDENRPSKTFGANISDLIADSFFIENSLIGDFVYDVIQETIKWLNDENDDQRSEYYRSVINMIDEPIIQRKLAEMYDYKMKEKFQLNIVDAQIKRLQSLRKNLDK